MVEDKDKNHDRDYIMANPESMEVWGFVMETARVFEDEFGYTRQQVCEGLLKATLDLAVRREDEQYFQEIKDIRHFHKWALSWVRRKFDEYAAPEEQVEYEEKYGKDPLWLRDAKNFGWVESKKTKQ